MSRLEAVIGEFAKTVRIDLRRRSLAKNRCRSMSAKFAAFAAARGLPVEGILEMKFHYLGERKVAFRHHAVLIGSKVIDWTANQFFETSVPAVFDSADEWTQEIDESLGGRYEYPEVEVLAAKKAGLSAGKHPRAFVVVHLSSIDSFNAQGGDAEEVLSNIAMSARESPVVIVLDQGWRGRWADKARRELREAAPGAVWIEHDEDAEGWERIDRGLPRMLTELGVRDVDLGGFWLDDCVAHVDKLLKKSGFRVRIDEDSTGGD